MDTTQTIAGKQEVPCHVLQLDGRTQAAVDQSNVSRSVDVLRETNVPPKSSDSQSPELYVFPREMLRRASSLLSDGYSLSSLSPPPVLCRQDGEDYLRDYINSMDPKDLPAFGDSFGGRFPSGNMPVLSEKPEADGSYTESPYTSTLRPPRAFSEASRMDNFRMYNLGTSDDKRYFNEDGRIVGPFLKYDETMSSRYVISDLKGGCRLSPEFRELSVNRKLRGFFSYFLLSDLYPLFYFFRKRDRERFDRYYAQLWKGKHTWRAGDVSADFWRFLISIPDILPLILSLTFAHRKHAARYLEWIQNSLQKCLDFQPVLALLRKPIDAPIEYQVPTDAFWAPHSHLEPSLILNDVDLESISSVFDWDPKNETPTQRCPDEPNKRAKSDGVEEIQGPLSRRLAELYDTARKDAVLEVQGPFSDAFRRRLVRRIEGWFASRPQRDTRTKHFASERLWRSYRDDAADSIVHFSLMFGDKIQTVDTMLTLIKHGEGIRALLQAVKLLTASAGLIGIIKALIGSIEDYRSLGSAWLNPDGDDLEIEEIQGPNDVFNSLLFKKFSVLLSAFLAEPILNRMPTFLQNTITGVLANVKEIVSLGDLYEALKSFMYVFLERCQEFCLTWDWKVFLDSGGFGTWIIRANDWCQHAGSKKSPYSTLPELIAAGKALVEEGDMYYSAEYAKNNPGKKFTSDHIVMYKALTAKLTKIQNERDSAEPRKRVPFTVVLVGPPGSGKTYICSEILRYILKKEGRPIDENGNPQMSGADMYAAPKDKHWNNCHNPKLVIFNDLLGDGYVNNGSTANMADLLRLAADIEPFYTPQASLEDKLKCVIDPAGVVWTGNTMVYDFSCFGTDWSKLIRRYKKIYYCAYPSKCYSTDIEEVGADHGKLLDPAQEFKPDLANDMRYYSCRMLHRAGKIFFVREKLVATGVNNFMKIVREDYRESLATKNVAPVLNGNERCCEDHPLAAHTEKCCYDCDWVDPTPKPAKPGIANPLYEHPLQVDEVQCWPLVDAVSDNVSERVAQRYENKIRAVFSDMKPYFGALAMALTAGLATWGFFAGVKKLRRKPESVVEEFIAEKTGVQKVEGNVINPIKVAFTPAFLDTFSPSEAKAKEAPNPATWATTSRAYATFSEASKSAAFDDVVAKVGSNTVEFFCDEAPNRYGSGVFLSANYMLVNKHTVDSFKGRMLRVRSKEDNGLRYEFDFHRIASVGDICVAKVPPYPASNILQHIAYKVGQSFEGKFHKHDVIVSRRGVNFGGLIGIGEAELLCYNYAAQNGDCGKPLVAKVDKNGAFVGIHVVKLVSGESGAWPLDRKVIDSLIDQLGDRPVGMIMQSLVEEIQTLHPKSRLRAAKGVSMVVLGTSEKSNKLAKSCLIKTPMHDEIFSLMENPKVIPSLHIDGVKRDEGWMAPYVHKFAGMSLEMRDAKQCELERALDDYIDRMPVDSLKPLTLDQAIAGVEGDKLLKKLNLKTSAGIFQRFYPDKSYLLDLDEMTITEELRNKIEEKANLLRFFIIIEHQKWALKDEPVEILKEFRKKYRYFMVSDFDNLILFRIFVSPLVAHMYRHRAFFEACGAFNPASPQFGELMNWLRRFSNLVMADMKHMDSTYRAMIAEYVAKFFYVLAKRCGYNEEAAMVVLNLIRATCFSIVEFCGDWAFFSEGMGSGIYVTFVVNCVILSLLYRVAWFRLNSTPFREHNALVAGGDDSAMSTDDTRFDGIHILKTFRDYGYEVSPPTDKTGEVVPFYDHRETVFLKRSPSTVVCRGKTYEVGKLAMDSILKPLAFEMPSVGVSHRDRMAQALDAACREMALHGLEAFLSFKKMISKYGYSYRQLSYDAVIEMYVAGDLYTGIDDPFVPTFELVQEVNFYPHSDFSDSFQRKKLLPSNKITQDTLPLMTEKLLPGNTRSMSHVSETGWGKAMMGLRVYYHLRYIKVNTLTDFIGNDSHMTSSEKTTTFDLASSMVESTTVPKQRADYGTIQDPITLATSLARPTYLTSVVWTPLSVASQTTDIYTMWRTDSLISSKLHGFKFFRGKPVLRFVVNGFVFYYGKMVCSIDLNPGDDGTVRATYDPQINTFQMVNVAQGMMAPHVSIDPSASLTYDLEVPFYSATGWYNLFDVTKAPTLRISFFPLNPLSSANDVAPTSVEIKVYLMMQEVELSVPAVAAIQGPGEIEPTGTISAPLNIVSKAAGALKIIPELAPFAGPLEVVASIGSKLAAMLGYSKPVIMEESRPTLNLTTGYASYTSGRAAVSKLTADPKQEVAVSAAAATVGDDSDMLLSSITSRFGLIDTFEWTTTGLTYSIAVKPDITSFKNTLGNTQLLPISYVANLFKYWSGSIVFRIEIVASAMHRGAIAVSWIPYTDPPGGSHLNYPNKFLTKIIDITQTKLVDFEVPFAGDLPNLPIDVANGVLRFYELNALKSSGSTSSVGINLYVKAGPDFQLFRPLPSSLARTVSFIPVSAVQGPVIETEPHSQSGSGSFPVADVMPGREKIYFGETVTSLKQLCNRDCMAYYGKVLAPTGTTGDFNWAFFRMPPFPLGLIEENFPETSYVKTAFNYPAWFSPAFLAMRGGFRYKVAFPTGVNLLKDLPGESDINPKNYQPGNFNCMASSLEQGTLDWFSPAVMDMMESFSPTTNAAAVMTAAGAVYDNLMIHPALEFEMPYTNPGRFVNPRKQTPWYKADLNAIVPAVGFVPKAIFDADLQQFQQVQIFMSGADDFSLHGFMFIPECRTVLFPI
jgi:hypothetical protein